MNTKRRKLNFASTWRDQEVLALCHVLWVGYCGCEKVMINILQLLTASPIGSNGVIGIVTN